MGRYILLLFRRGRVLRTLEEGLQWRSSGVSAMPRFVKAAPEGVFIHLPKVYESGRFEQYLRALEKEAGFALGRNRPVWAHLHGAGIYELPMNALRAVVQAACPDASVGVETDPALLEPGAVAGYRAAGVERFCFLVTSQRADIDEPVRRARALGAFVSAEICFGGAMSGRQFLQVVERALGASPNQIALRDVRGRGALGAEMLEKAGEICQSVGYGRRSVCVWAKPGECFDALGLMLSGKCLGLGPDAVNFSTGLYAGPELRRWLEQRLAGRFDAVRAGGRAEQWLPLAAGLYRLELRREDLDSRLYRHALALERAGIVDRRGRPSSGWPMEFCHRAARAARQALLGCDEYPPQAGGSVGEFRAAGKG